MDAKVIAHCEAIERRYHLEFIYIVNNVKRQIHSLPVKCRFRGTSIRMKDWLNQPFKNILKTLIKMFNFEVQ